MRIFSVLWMALALVAGEAVAQTYSNPVFPGDLPDPSVIRVGKEYWATATSSEWAPHFPLLKSKDLVNWTVVGAVFTNQPAWAVANFWAPEIEAWKGKYYVYYVARQRGGALSVAVATAARPEGPYTDHGIIVSQDVGSIDPMAVDDENGQRYLVWKDDGNSRNQPTHLWAAKLSADGTRIEGEYHPLFHNDAPWEGKVIEGPYVLRRDGWFYLFYSGSGCCGADCNYALGVARSRKLLGPWEKYEGNPILAGNQAWRCPGHGSIVQDATGRDWLMYHAYSTNGFVASGRQGMLDEVKWQANGWPEINNGCGPSVVAQAPKVGQKPRAAGEFKEEFSRENLGPGWNWRLHRRPQIKLDHGQVKLACPNEDGTEGMASLARSVPSGTFTVSTAVDLSHTDPTAAAGLAIIGDAQNASGLQVRDGSLTVWTLKRGKREQLGSVRMPSPRWVHLRVQSQKGLELAYSFSPDGKQWQVLGPGVSTQGMPPWDRALRAGIYVDGPPGKSAAFDFFHLVAANGTER